MKEGKEQSEQPRVRLRPLTVNDAQAYLDLMAANRDHFANFNNTPRDKYQTIEDAQRALAAPEKTRWGIYDTQNRLIGTINLAPEKRDSNDTETPDVLAGEVGYLIASSETGKGYATAALVALIDNLKQQDLFVRLVATTHPENGASQTVLEKAGFTKVGETPDGEYRFSLRIKE